MLAGDGMTTAPETSPRALGALEKVNKANAVSLNRVVKRKIRRMQWSKYRFVSGYVP